jgi:hypothetical protein
VGRLGKTLRKQGFLMRRGMGMPVKIYSHVTTFDKNAA